MLNDKILTYLCLQKTPACFPKVKKNLFFAPIYENQDEKQRKNTTNNQIK